MPRPRQPQATWCKTGEQEIWHHLIQFFLNYARKQKKPVCRFYRLDQSAHIGRFADFSNHFEVKFCGNAQVEGIWVVIILAKWPPCSKYYYKCAHHQKYRQPIFSIEMYAYSNSHPVRYIFCEIYVGLIQFNYNWII